MKPSNVLLQINQDQYDIRTISLSHVTVKLCDFGLARYFEPDASSLRAMTTAGTIKYAAPEIRENLLKKLAAHGRSSESNPCVSEYSQSCDIFSTAVVAFELVTGETLQGEIIFRRIFTFADFFGGKVQLAKIALA